LRRTIQYMLDHTNVIFFELFVGINLQKSSKGRYVTRYWAGYSKVWLDFSIASHMSHARSTYSIARMSVR
jgi:hypothetical protein